MKKLFIHRPLFRIISPIFSGVIVYLLILLLNNNVEQLQEQFLGEELYVCIGLSYLIQELSRLFLLAFKRFQKRKNTLLYLLLQIVISLVLSIVMVTISISLYYTYAIGYSASTEEILMFDSIFSVITFIYILLFLSHEYLYKINSEKLQQEELIKQNIEDDFRQFKRGVNPHLLFESFEALIVLMHQNDEEAEEFIDHIATIYRYILHNKDKQLVSIKEETIHLTELQKLFNKLPYRSLAVNFSISSDFLIVPGSLLFLLELIVRNTIASSKIQLEVDFSDTKKSILISYKTYDKINSKLKITDFEEISRVYSIYSSEEITMKDVEGYRTISLPKLITKK